MSAGRATATLGDLDEQARNVLFDRLQERMPQVWRGMQQGDPLESVVVVPVDDAWTGWSLPIRLSPRRWRSDSCSCSCCCASRGSG